MSSYSISYNANLRSLYNEDRRLGTKAGRKDAENTTLIAGDIKALNRGLKNIGRYDFGTSDTDTKDEKTAFYKNLKAVMDTYNNSIETTSKSENPQVKKVSKRLAKLASKYEDELGDVGISIDKKGYMTISESAVDNYDVSRFKKVFGDDSDFMKEFKKYTKNLSNHIDEYA
ncbi:MAG: hypothetical protein J6N76_01065 [Lachnospiraceae bacterium]|nr:hypothetical protein [Lachnospiraceae bacterium]